MSRPTRISQLEVRMRIVEHYLWHGEPVRDVHELAQNRWLRNWPPAVLKRTLAQLIVDERVRYDEHGVLVAADPAMHDEAVAA